jgi:hypothetical protein
VLRSGVGLRDGARLLGGRLRQRAGLLALLLLLRAGVTRLLLRLRSGRGSGLIRARSGLRVGRRARGDCLVGSDDRRIHHGLRGDLGLLGLGRHGDLLLLALLLLLRLRLRLLARRHVGRVGHDDRRLRLLGNHGLRLRLRLDRDDRHGLDGHRRHLDGLHLGDRGRGRVGVNRVGRLRLCLVRVVLHAVGALGAVGLTTLGTAGSLALSALGSCRVVVATLLPLHVLGASVLAFRSGGPGLM